MGALKQCNKCVVLLSFGLFYWGRWNKESISALVNLGGRGMWKASFLGKRAGNTTWKNQTKLLLFPSGSEQAGNIKVVLSLPKAHWVFLLFFFFFFFERWGLGIGLYGFWLNLSNNVVSSSLEQLFPVQLTLFIPLPLHRGKRSDDDVWAQLQSLVCFSCSCSGPTYSSVIFVWIPITGSMKPGLFVVSLFLKPFKYTHFGGNPCDL